MLLNMRAICGCIGLIYLCLHHLTHPQPYQEVNEAIRPRTGIIFADTDTMDEPH